MAKKKAKVAAPTKKKVAKKRSSEATQDLIKQTDLMRNCNLVEQQIVKLGMQGLTEEMAHLHFEQGISNAEIKDLKKDIAGLTLRVTSLMDAIGDLIQGTAAASAEQASTDRLLSILVDRQNKGQIV